MTTSPYSTSLRALVQVGGWLCERCEDEAFDGERDDLADLIEHDSTTPERKTCDGCGATTDCYAVTFHRGGDRA